MVSNAATLAIALTSLAISVITAAITLPLQILNYRRSHVERLKVDAFNTCVFIPRGSGVAGAGVISIDVVNSGAAAVTVDYVDLEAPNGRRHGKRELVDGRSLPVTLGRAEAIMV